jgi:hypothetical protein
MGETRNVYRILVEKALGKLPHRRLRRSWVDNIKMGLSDTGCEDGEVFGTGLRLCTVVGFFVSVVEPSGFPTKYVVRKKICISIE